MNTDKGVKIKKLQKADLTQFIELIKLFEDVFELKALSIPDSNHLQNVLSRTEFAVFIAIKENKVVGGLTAYTLEQYYSEKPIAHIYDLAVASNLQRQGIGKKLIAATNDYYLAQGYEEVFVQAEKFDDHAVDFYRSTRPSQEEQVVHFCYLLNK